MRERNTGVAIGSGHAGFKFKENLASLLSDPLTKAEDKMAKCNLCSHETDSLILEIEQTVINMIKKSHPNWVQEDGSCQKCIEYYEHLDEVVQVQERDAIGER